MMNVSNARTRARLLLLWAVLLINFYKHAESFQVTPLLSNHVICRQSTQLAAVEIQGSLSKRRRVKKFLKERVLTPFISRNKVAKLTGPSNYLDNLNGNDGKKTRKSNSVPSSYLETLANNAPSKRSSKKVEKANGYLDNLEVGQLKFTLTQPSTKMVEPEPEPEPEPEVVTVKKITPEPVIKATAPPPPNKNGRKYAKPKLGAQKYAAIDSLEEKAFQILVDLGMVQKTN